MSARKTLPRGVARAQQPTLERHVATVQQPEPQPNTSSEATQEAPPVLHRAGARTLPRIRPWHNR